MNAVKALYDGAQIVVGTTGGDISNSKSFM